MWLALFPNDYVETLVAPASDHYPTLLNRNPLPRHHLCQRNFRYKNAWQLEPGFKDLVSNSWQVYASHSLISKLSHCANDMSDWKKSHCQNLKRDIEDFRKQLQSTRMNSTGEDQVCMYELRKRMQRLLAQDDAYWRQRAKTHWYKNGDRNTKNFHASPTTRKKVNHLLSLEDEEGNKVTSEQGLCDIAQQYFENIFQKKHGDFSSVIDVINSSISASDNALLTTPFVKVEFHEAIFFMHPDKCPGPNDYNPGFFQHFWNLCYDDIFKECFSW